MPGAADATVLAQEGRIGLRQWRILRLVDEALEQGGVLTEEDQARVLGVPKGGFARLDSP
ncbi:MAG: DUF1670 domain-containing protein [Acidobacteria bacterium]|nr:DUF1670 domain-containing protein [Acidobacteriota bacterium]